MIVTPIKTRRVEPNALSLTALLDESITELAEGSIVAITSKVVSLCEGAVIPLNKITKDELINQEATWHLPATFSAYGYHFSITNNTLISMAGVDESNGNDHYILWPRNPLKTARTVRDYVIKRFNLRDVGVIITDSSCQPMRRGTIGISLAHCGFKGLHNYIGQPDLFGRPFSVSVAGVASGLASTAVVAMGEGTEQTPLVILADTPSVTFSAEAPDTAELAMMRLEPDEDLFAPFFKTIQWLPGQGRATPKI